MQRGEILTVAMAGDFGKLRPAVIIQTDQVGITDTILVCLISSDLQDFSSIRIDIPATPETGLERPSQIMVEKIFAVVKVKCRKRIGKIDSEIQGLLNESLFMMIGLEPNERGTSFPTSR